MISPDLKSGVDWQEVKGFLTRDGVNFKSTTKEPVLVGSWQSLNTPDYILLQRQPMDDQPGLSVQFGRTEEGYIALAIALTMEEQYRDRIGELMRRYWKYTRYETGGMVSLDRMTAVTLYTKGTLLLVGDRFQGKRKNEFVRMRMTLNLEDSGLIIPDSHRHSRNWDRDSSLSIPSYRVF